MGNKRTMLSCGILICAVIMLLAGILRGEAKVVLEKATKICLECIGIG